MKELTVVARGGIYSKTKTGPRDQKGISLMGKYRQMIGRTEERR
jgi:hypothetical protein